MKKTHFFWLLPSFAAASAWQGPMKQLQQFAVDSSSLHIPLLFGLDVVHGYGVQMPVPLAGVRLLSLF